MTGPVAIRIGVIGSGENDERVASLARETGRAIALAEAVLVCGGLGGVMAAAAEGAAAVGGSVLGLLPGEDATAAAPGVTIPVPTGVGQARNVLVVRTSDVVIAMAGGWGTLSEASFCRKLRVPLVGLCDTLPDIFEIPRFEEPAAAVARALELAGAGREEA